MLTSLHEQIWIQIFSFSYMMILGLSELKLWDPINPFSPQLVELPYAQYNSTCIHFFLIPKTDKLILKLANFLFVIWYKESLKYKPGTWYIAFLALFLGHWAPLAWRPVAKNKQNCLTSSSMCGWAGEIDEARFSYQNYTLWKENRGLINYW